jgi:hypothetical protein
MPPKDGVLWPLRGFKTVAKPVRNEIWRQSLRFQVSLSQRFEKTAVVLRVSFK